MKPFRIGIGYDVHRFAAGRPLILGGVEIPSDFGLEGHSDADVLSHAIADAILGACGLPDIGHYFPPSDEGLAGINSQKILAKALQEARHLGYGIGNIDSTIIAEKPKVLPHLEPMKARLSQTLEIEADAIGIKATTHEKLGSLGRGEGMAAQAVCLLIAEK